MEFYENKDIENIVTPVKLDKLKELLQRSVYDKEKTKFLLGGFANGFDLEYEGPTERRNLSRNLPFTVGDKFQLWTKVMKEVKLGRYAGPFKNVPFQHFVQSPIGLVPKAGGQTRLIFHLSYDFKQEKSVNAYTDQSKCSVKYKDLDHAVKESLDLLKRAMLKQVQETGRNNNATCIWYGISDIKSAFHILLLKVKCFWLLVMKAFHPVTGEEYFFVDKCLPFGHCISCALFQKFSDALAYMVKYLIKVKRSIETTPLSNYLDDFLFAAISQQICSIMIQEFLFMCNKLGVPISHEKTEWANTIVMFLGILLDRKYQVLAIPEDKRLRALNSLELMLSKKKSTVRDLQALAGLLNFLNKAIIPRRAFTR